MLNKYLTQKLKIMFIEELQLSIEEMLVIKGGNGDIDDEGSTGLGNGEIEP